MRQVRVGGAPVFETRLRIPGGDAVQRVWSVADGGGRTIIEVTNDSPLPIACALSRRDLLTARPPADVPIEGIDLPATTIVLPIGHRAAVTVALDHHGGGAGSLPAGSAPAEATARGWVAFAERASRFTGSHAEVLVAARAEVALSGAPDPADDPVGHLLAVCELTRLGELGDDALDDVAVAVHAIARRDGWDIDAALDAAAMVLVRGGERRAGSDLARIVAGRRPAPPPEPAEVDGVRVVAALERRLVRGGELFPDGIPRRGGGATWRPTACSPARPRRCRSRCAGTDRTPPSCGRSRGRPSSSAPPPSTPRGAPASAAARHCGASPAELTDLQRRANSTRRCVKSLSTTAPVQRWW